MAVPAAFSNMQQSFAPPAAFVQASAVTILPQTQPVDIGLDGSVIQRPRAEQAVVALLEGTAGSRGKAAGAPPLAPTLMMPGQPQLYEPLFEPLFEPTPPGPEVIAAARAGKLVQSVAAGLLDPQSFGTMMLPDPAALLGGLPGMDASMFLDHTGVPPLYDFCADPTVGLGGIVPTAPAVSTEVMLSGNGTGDPSAPKLVPLKPEDVMPTGMDGKKGDPMMAAMMTPVTEGLLQGAGIAGPSAVELLQLAATDPNGAVAQINMLMGQGTCDLSTVQAAAMQLTMRSAYAFSTNMAKTMGYHSLEHYELHKQAIVKASNNRGKKGGGKGGPTPDSDKRLTLFVGGLKKDTDDDKVRDHFAKYGEVTRADVIRNADGTSRGFGFVKFAREDEIQACMDAKFEHILDGQWVNVKISDPNRADAGKNASRAVEMAAAQAGVEPSQYLNYLTQLAQTKYGYSNAELDQHVSSSRSAPY